MVEPSQDLGWLIFTALILSMVVCAGVASLPPARDFRVFVGAAIFFSASTLSLWIQTSAGSWDAISPFFLLDVLYAAAFYELSRPSARIAAYERNWAGYVAGVFAFIVVLELANFLIAADNWAADVASGLLFALFAFLLFGFARGFGPKAAGIFVLVIGAIAISAIITYVRVLNFLTLLGIIIILWRASKGAARNVSAWFGLVDHRGPGDDNGVQRTLQPGLAIAIKRARSAARYLRQ